jgi:hypothetical protein
MLLKRQIRKRELPIDRIRRDRAEDVHVPLKRLRDGKEGKDCGCGANRSAVVNHSIPWQMERPSVIARLD